MKHDEMIDEQRVLFFGVRRSIRYHDRRSAFYEGMHQLTGALTILLAGSVLFDISRPGNPPWWMLTIAAFAAVLSAFDMVSGYAKKADLHRSLKTRFGKLEIDIIKGGNDDDTWASHQQKRLTIEQDEPPIYRALDLLCHNELMRADGYDEENYAEHYARLSPWQHLTRHLFHWPDLKTH